MKQNARDLENASLINSIESGLPYFFYDMWNAIILPASLIARRLFHFHFFFFFLCVCMFSLLNNVLLELFLKLSLNEFLFLFVSRLNELLALCFWGAS